MFIVSKFLRERREKAKLQSLGVNCLKTNDYRNGFSTSTLDVCGITRENYTDFLSDRDYALGHPYNGAYSSIIDNKLYLPMMLHAYKEYIPEYYFFISDGELSPLEDSEFYGFSPRVKMNELISLLRKKEKLVLKHTHQSVGKGFMLLEYKSDSFWINKKDISENDLLQLLSSLNQYIVTEYVYQHQYASEICSTSLNTLRFLCVWDMKKQQFFLARGFQRFGCNGNVVDNIGSGNGVLVFVDVEKGELTGNGAVNLNHSGDKYRENIIHPDHNITLKGIKIPHFSEIKSKILEIANANSYLKYIGFDVAVTNEGFKIIETNSFSALEVSQQREGFLRDERIKNILKSDK